MKFFTPKKEVRQSGGKFNGGSIRGNRSKKVESLQRQIQKMVYPRRDLIDEIYNKSKFGGINRSALLSFDEPRGIHEKHEFVDTFNGESAFQYAVRCRLMGMKAVVWPKLRQSEDSIESVYVVSVHKDENYYKLPNYMRKRLHKKENQIRKSFGKYDKRRNKIFSRKGRRPSHNLIDRYDRSVTSDLPRKI